MEKKSELFTQFKRFQVQVEKQVECSIRKLGNDGRGEYTSDDYAQLCEK